jgi:hypothetical protein
METYMVEWCEMARLPCSDNDKRIIVMDKILHFSISALIALSLVQIGLALWLSLLITMVVGAAKEAYDIFVQKDNTWKQSFADMSANMMGLLYVAILVA